MIQNLFLRECFRRYRADPRVRRALGAGDGLWAAAGARSERKTILEKGLRELWFLAMLVVQWWADKLPAAEAKIINQGSRRIRLSRWRRTSIGGERLERSCARRMRPAPTPTWPEQASFQSALGRRGERIR